MSDKMYEFEVQLLVTVTARDRREAQRLAMEKCPLAQEITDVSLMCEAETPHENT